MRPPFRKVRVKWCDAYSDDGWLCIKGYEHKDEIVETEGYLISETPAYIVVAMSVSQDSEGEWQAGTVWGIPRGCIIAPRKLRKT